MYILSLQMKIISSLLCVSFYFNILMCSSFYLLGYQVITGPLSTLYHAEIRSFIE